MARHLPCPFGSIMAMLAALGATVGGGATAALRGATAAVAALRGAGADGLIGAAPWSAQARPYSPKVNLC